MAGPRWRRALCAAVVVLLPLAAWFGHRALQQSLERQARQLDLARLIRDAGLSGRVDPPRWSGSRLVWLPRPQLRLLEVEAAIHSGRPGPGRTSGRFQIDTVHLIPRWGFPLIRGLEQVQFSGGFVEVGRDLLPEIPVTYIDPVENRVRSVPWSALLDLVRWVPTNADAGKEEPPAAPWGQGSSLPLFSARDLDLRIVGLEIPPDRVLGLDQARLEMRPGRIDLRGRLRVANAEGVEAAVPFRLVRRDAVRGQVNWEAQVGSRTSGIRATATQEEGEDPRWRVELVDGRGLVGAALLSGRSGAMRRLRWSGPWRLRVEGAGAFPAGLRESVVELESGRVSLDGGAGPEALARGRLTILPGRVDLPSLTLIDPEGSGDSASVRFTWLSTPEGCRVDGGLKGRLDPAWVGIFGESWRARGRVDFDLSIEGRYGGTTPWRVAPRGRLRGELDEFAGPWFADTLRQGRIDVWGAGSGLGCVVAGIWGRSVFRLETRGLPDPRPEYLDLVAAGGSWTLTSPGCRLEDFRLDPGRFPRTGEAPFWLGLPGRGRVRIDTGSIRGVPFADLRATFHRSRGGNRIDSLAIEIAGGRLENGPSAPAARRTEPAGRSTGVLRLRGEQLDLATLQGLLSAYGVRLPGHLEGTLGGSFQVRWPEPGGSLDQTEFRAAVRIERGSLRGLPGQEALRRRTGLDRMAVLSFHDLTLELERKPEQIRWDRLRLVAPEFRAEGAGRIGRARELDAVLRVRPAAEGDLGRLIGALLSEDQALLYARIHGPPATPEVTLLSRQAFRRALESMGGTLPDDDAGR